MTTYTWTSNSGGDWNTSSNWNPSGPPGASDTAVIGPTAGTYTATVAAGETPSLANLTLSSSTVTVLVNGTLTGAAASTFSLKSGTLSALNGGTIVVGTGGLGIAGTTASSATVTVSGTHSTLRDSGGINVGLCGAGLLQVLTGSTIELTGSNGITAGVSVSAATGTVVVSGTGSVLQLDSTAGGMTIGNSGQGTVEALNGGTIAMNGTGGIIVGSGTGSNLLEVSGTGAVLNQSTNGARIAVGGAAAGSGTLEVLAGGTMVLNGTRAASDALTGFVVGKLGAGTVLVDGIGSSLTLGASATIGYGAAGMLTVNAGTLSDAGNFIVSFTTSAAGTVTLQGGGLIDAGTVTIGGAGFVTIAGSGLTASALSTNSGTIQGFGTLHAAWTNSGTVTASGGTLLLTGAENGTGSDTIANGATLEEGGTVGAGQTVSFVAGATASALQLDQLASHSQNFGLINWQDGDSPILNTGLTVTGAAMINGNTLAVQTSAGEYDFAGVTVAAGSSPVFTTGTNSVTLICFRAGTLIDTPAGQVPVQAVKAGDMVLTAHNGPRKVTWVGQGKVLATRGRRSAATPVIVRKGALADNIPARDLHITKAHALFIDGVLIPVEFLVNHRTIVWDDHAQEVELYHIELESHDLLIANGAPAESYRDDGNRWLFHNANSGWHLPPQEPCAPILTGGSIVDNIWKRLLTRAGARKLPPMTDDAGLHLLVDGVRLSPAEVAGDRWVFFIPGQPQTIRILSREAVPAELGISRDSRSLGVAMRKIEWHRGLQYRAIAANDPRLTDGFHGYEPNDDVRWTNGDAALPADLLPENAHGALKLVLTLAGKTLYPDWVGFEPVRLAVPRTAA